MAITALVVKVPEAEAMVGALRARFDATAQLGVPAHITILFPFMPPDAVTPAVLQRVQAALDCVPAFAYALASVGRFDETAFLAPTPPEPFIRLTAAVAAQFPEFPPYGGRHQGMVPHLTVAHGSACDAALAATDLQAQLPAGAGIRAWCGSVSLLENASGRWKDMHAFDLPG